MPRLSIHLPQLASLALAMIAAAVSHSLHVERSASSRAGESRHQTAGPTPASGRPRPGSASGGREAVPRGADRTVRGAERRGNGDRASGRREPQEPLDRRSVLQVAAHRPPAWRRHHVDRLRAEPGVKNESLVGPPTPAPAAPAPAPLIPSPPDSPSASSDVAPATGAPDDGTGTAAAPTTAVPVLATPDNATENAGHEDPGAGQATQPSEDASPSPEDP